jgi:hypothetical protein
LSRESGLSCGDSESRRPWIVRAGGDTVLSFPLAPSNGDCCSDSEWLNSDSESEFIVRLRFIVRFIWGLARSAELCGAFSWFAFAVR